MSGIGWLEFYEIGRLLLAWWHAFEWFGAFIRPWMNCFGFKYLSKIYKNSWNKISLVCSFYLFIFLLEFIPTKILNKDNAKKFILWSVLSVPEKRYKKRKSFKRLSTKQIDFSQNNIFPFFVYLFHQKSIRFSFFGFFFFFFLSLPPFYSFSWSKFWSSSL